jgi:hypothetical protein
LRDQQQAHGSATMAARNMTTGNFSKASSYNVGKMWRVTGEINNRLGGLGKVGRWFGRFWGTSESSFWEEYSVG